MFMKPLGIFWLYLQWLTTASSRPNGQDSLDISIGEMTNSIMLRHFRNAPCVAIVTEINPNIIDYIPKSLLRFLIQIGGKRKDSPILNLQESDTLNYAILNDVTLKFEELLIDSLNAGCPVYVIQVSNPKAVIHCFARASRRAMFRANRKYLILPVVTGGSVISNSSSMEVENIFGMKEMDYMPDLVIARVRPNTDRPKGNAEKVGRFSRSCNNASLTFCYRSNSQQRECTGKGSSKIAGNVSSGFEIELLTHSFTGTESSKTLFLDVWVPDTDGCGGGFLKSAELFIDKTRDMKGKELTIITWDYPPFIIMDFDSNPPLYDGIEFRIILEFLRYINCTFRQVFRSWDILMLSRVHAMEGR
jgi:hypothetical protein